MDIDKNVSLKKYETELYEYKNAFIAGNCNFASNVISPVMEHANEVLNNIDKLRDEIDMAVAEIKKLEARDAEEERQRKMEEERRKQEEKNLQNKTN